MFALLPWMLLKKVTISFSQTATGGNPPQTQPASAKTPTIAPMQRKIFWTIFILLGLLADFMLPFWWAFGSTIPIVVIAWWIAYRSDWF
jgi:hypothetical protein